jgi:hypothetical protein
VALVDAEATSRERFPLSSLPQMFRSFLCLGQIVLSLTLYFRAGQIFFGGIRFDLISRLAHA